MYISESNLYFRYTFFVSGDAKKDLSKSSITTTGFTTEMNISLNGSE